MLLKYFGHGVVNLYKYWCITTYIMRYRMTRKYKEYLGSLFNEATPQFGKRIGDATKTKRQKGSYEDDAKVSGDDTTGKIISDYVAQLAEAKPKSFGKFATPVAIEALTRMATKAIQMFEYDKEGNSIDPTAKDGLGVMSNQFGMSENPLYKALYLLVASRKSGLNVGVDEVLPFELVSEIMEDDPENTLQRIAKMSDEEINNSIMVAPKLSRVFDNMVKSARFEPVSPNKTLSGRDTAGQMSKTGHGRLNALVSTLVDIDREYFDKNASTSGQNYGGVKDTNEAIGAFINSMITNKTKQSGTSAYVGKLKSALQNTDRSIALGNFKGSKLDVFNTVANSIDKQIVKLSDPEKILNSISVGMSPEAIKSLGGNQLTWQALKTHYAPLTKGLRQGKLVGGRESEVSTPVEPKLMLSIIDKLYEFDPQLMHVSQLLDFVEGQYDSEDAIVQHYHELLRKSGLDRDINAPDDEEIKGLGKTESFYMMMDRILL